MRAAASFPRWRPLWALFLRKMSENTSPQPTQQKHLDFKKTLGNWWYILNQTIVPVKALKKSGYQKTLSGNNASAAVHPSYVKHPLFSWPTQHWGFRLQVQVLFWGFFFIKFVQWREIRDAEVGKQHNWNPANQSTRCKRTTGCDPFVHATQSRSDGLIVKSCRY